MAEQEPGPQGLQPPVLSQSVINRMPSGTEKKKRMWSDISAKPIMGNQVDAILGSVQLLPIHLRSLKIIHYLSRISNFTTGLSETEI